MQECEDSPPLPFLESHSIKVICETLHKPGPTGLCNPINPIR